MTSSRFRIIAHRGASAHAPENTIAALEAAIELEADEVEIDVRLSADGEIVVFHDDRLDEKTALRGRVRHYDARLLEQADLLPWFRSHRRTAIPPAPESTPNAGAVLGSSPDTCISRLETILDRFGEQFHYHIEIKGWDDILPLGVLRMIEAYGLRHRVTLTSFSQRPLNAIRKLDPEIPITFLLRDAADAMRSGEFRPELEGKSLEAIHAYWIEEAKRSDFQWVGVRASDLSRETIEFARAREVQIRCWGIRTEAHLRHAARLGAAGATVDWPGRARDLLREAGR